MARYAISDIHGCSKSFNAVLGDLKLEKGDELFLLGDYVGKGPDSKGVLDMILDLQNNSSLKISALRGNHEQKLLDAYESRQEAEQYLQDPDNTITLESFGVKTPAETPQKCIEWLKNLGYYCETNEHILVHAGLNFDADEPLSDHHSMLYIKNFNVDPARINNKCLIHGHNPQDIMIIHQQMFGQCNRINIDGGCVYYKNPELGHLIAIDIDTKQLFAQPNIDSPYNIAIKH
ncbi:metallophosphoesterase [Cytophagaceae bacterium ABcell3]|nr:metallophosphoesterase [Cytophagaceae bacterium ABcell3]